jgi:hypothetical protein
MTLTVGPAAGPVHLPGHWPHAKAIFGARPEQLRSSCTAQPCFEVSGIEQGTLFFGA